jgi:hypothetical protein
MRGALLLALACLFATGCETVIEEPPCPPIEIPASEGECSTFCNCKAEDMSGRAFRMTRLEVDEPEEFAALLNNLWKTDIKNNTLNIIFYVTDAVQGTSAAFNRISVNAGSGWRTPRDPLAIPPGEGQASADVVDSYCLLEGLDAPFELKPYHGYQCVFKSENTSRLFFHTGPKDIPLMCSPEGERPNAIPIKTMSTRMSFNENCTEITNGYLEGCITIDDADKICMCLQSGKCPLEPEGKGHEEGDLAGYCHDLCGATWLSFGESVAAFNLLPSCITEDGEQGYRLQGFFDAVALGDKFNPVQSNDCTKK